MMLFFSTTTARLLLTLLSCVVTQTVAIPTTDSSLNLTQRGVPAWQFYYGSTAAQHQASYNTLSSAGYRPISLSTYSQPPNNLYAAVWVQRSGPAFAAIHAASTAQYQAFFNARVAEGYVSTIITATGPSGSPVFAGVMEKNGVTAWYQKCGLIRQDYIDAQITASKTGYVLKSFTEYGLPTADRRYCGIWYYSPAQSNLYTAYTDQTYGDYQASFTQQTSMPGGWHPSYFSVTEDHFMNSQFTNTNIGSWASSHGMTPSVLQTQYQTQAALGRYIIHLQGGGSGANVHYAAIWGQQDIPI